MIAEPERQQRVGVVRMNELIGKPLHIDAFELLEQLPDGCADLAFVDPPYNIGVFVKMPAGEYLDWCKRWIAEC